MSPEPSTNPSTDEPNNPGSAAAPAREESRTKRVDRLARRICDSSPDLKARGIFRWKEALDAVIVVSPERDDEAVLDVMRALVRSGLALTRDNAVRAAQGTLGTVGRQVQNRHRDADDDAESAARRAAWQ